MATSSTFSTSNQYIKYRIVVTENSTSIPNNTSSVNVKVQAWRTNSGYTTYGTGTCYCKIDGTSYSQSISSSQTITYNSYTTLFNRDVTISHNSDGSKSIYVSASISHARFSTSTHGFTVNLTTIPRQAELVNVPNFNDEEDLTIEYTNPAGDVVDTLQACISLDNSTDTISYRDISKTGTSYTFELSYAELNTLRNATPNSNTLPLYVIVKTVLAGQTYYSSKAITMSIVNADPRITRNDYSDSNGSTYAITNDQHLIIQKQSLVQFAFQTVRSYKGATLTSCSVTVNSVTKTESLSGTYIGLLLMNFGAINSSSNVQARIVVTDSRGNTSTYTRPITMLAWSEPTAIISCKREQNFYSNTELTVNGEVSSLNNKNSMTIEYCYKETSSGTWISGGTIPDETPVTMSLDNTKTWDVMVTVQDKLATTTYYLTVDKGTPIIYFDRLRRSVGINCLPGEDDSLEVSGMNATKILGNVEPVLTKTYLNETTFVVELPFEVDANNQATGLMFAPGLLGLLQLSSTPAVTMIAGSAPSISLAGDNKTFTITAGGTISGITTILVGLYQTP